MKSLCVVLAILLGVVTAAVAAPPTEDEVRRAKAHYKQGAAYHDAGAYDQAIAEYQAAYELAPLPELIFNIAQVHRLKHDNQLALETYRRYLALRSDGPLADEARTQVALLTKELEAEQPGRETTSIPRPERTEPSATRSEPQRGRTLRIVGIATGVVGLGAIGVAIKFGLDARSASDRADQIAHDAEQIQSWSGGAAERYNAAVADGESAQRTMYIGYGVGAALVATGTVLYVIGVRAAREPMQVTPVVTSQVAGLSVRGAF